MDYATSFLSVMGVLFSILVGVIISPFFSQFVFRISIYFRHIVLLLCPLSSFTVFPVLKLLKFSFVELNLNRLCTSGPARIEF